MNTEGARISQLQQQAQRCAIQENLARARLYVGTTLPCNTSNYLGNTNIPSESAYLLSKPKCYNYLTPPVVAESVRINRIQSQYEYSGSCYVLDSNTRFLDYAPTPSIFLCPPITYSNGSVNNTCPLPNNPLNPVLGR
jgi:hypothetical protein